MGHHKEEDRPGVATEALQHPDRATTGVPLIVPAIDPDADSLTAALTYGQSGMYVLPVIHPTKDPGSAVGKAWHTQSSRDPQQIAAWFAGTSHDIALHCGRIRPGGVRR